MKIVTDEMLKQAERQGKSAVNALRSTRKNKTSAEDAQAMKDRIFGKGK